MRYLFVILMIALLPLRGWAGQVMAVNMAVQQISMAQKAFADQADKARFVAMPVDCPMLAQTTDDQSPASETSCSCDSCELCLALACVKDAGFFDTAFKPQPAPQAGSAGFTNAATASGLKPPIF